MVVSEQLGVKHPGRLLYLLVAPLLAGITMLVATLLPWITDPLGRNAIAWVLPIDPGWQVQATAVNYGVLCVLCAGYSFFVALRVWNNSYKKNRGGALPLRQEAPISRGYLLAAVLCLVPTVIFIFQYLCADMNSIALLTRNEMQLLLIKAHFGYSTPAQLVPLQLATFHPLDLTGRLALLTDLIGTGFFLPWLSCLILLFAWRTWRHSEVQYMQEEGGRVRAHSPMPGKRRIGLIAVLLILGVLLFGRAPAALICNYQAEHLLAIGNYSGALTWLDRAEALNPQLNALTAYHLERGQAQYYAATQQRSVDSQAYLAAAYQQRNDLLSAYQEMLTIWQTVPHSTQNAWLMDEMSQTLELLAESTKPTQGAIGGLLIKDEPALTWQNKLVTVDKTNLYAQYMIGRALYDLHDYVQSEQQMEIVLNLTQEDDVQSSAYTYIALSKIELGDEGIGREYLFKAQELDPDYRNNTARQELSGLR